MTAQFMPICVAALYQFTQIDDCESIRDALQTQCNTLGIRGTLLIAHEGINGTIAGTDVSVDAILKAVRSLPGCEDIPVKFSRAATMPFKRIKVKFKHEIVTMGRQEIDPRVCAGTYVAPKDWNALISAPDVVVIDTRNAYEVEHGSFAGAIDPGTRNFREFPEWFDREKANLLGAGRPNRIAMFCTGGIRCEKATAWVKSQGIEEVYHLEGGILKYLEEVPSDQSLWQGECFVFDERETVKEGLEPKR